MFIWYYYLMHYLGCNLFNLDVDYRLCITWIIHQQLWGYKVEKKLHLGVREQTGLNTTGLYIGKCSLSHEWNIEEMLHDSEPCTLGGELSQYRDCALGYRTRDLGFDSQHVQCPHQLWDPPLGCYRLFPWCWSWPFTSIWIENILVACSVYKYRDKDL
jgi:hypothetical protein